MTWFRDMIQEHNTNVKHPPPSTAELTDAFMRMDGELSQVATAVDNYRAVTCNTDIDAAWENVRDACDQATASYLSLTAVDAAATLTGASVDHGTQMLEIAIGQVEKFRGKYAKQLYIGIGAVQDIENNMLCAQQAAAAARTAYGKLQSSLQTYPSVREAEQQLENMLTALSAVRKQRSYSQLPTMISRVVEAATKLDTAVAEAPQLTATATNAVSSVASRLAAARTRLDGVKPALRALLREFAAASSTDLVDNENKAREHINTAADKLGRARAALHNGSPEDAMTLAKQIRDELRLADQLVDAVPNRLRMLHELRDNPETRSKKVRFELRDARMLAANRKVESKFAARFDNALERIERLEAGLAALHPDYWAYANGLDQVDDFIQSVVAQIRS